MRLFPNVVLLAFCYAFTVYLHRRSNTPRWKSHSMKAIGEVQVVRLEQSSWVRIFHFTSFTHSCSGNLCIYIYRGEHHPDSGSSLVGSPQDILQSFACPTEFLWNQNKSNMTFAWVCVGLDFSLCIDILLSFLHLLLGTWSGKASRFPAT